MTTMSLHRVIAEIKAAEQKLSQLSQNSYVCTALAGVPTEVAEAKTLSQSAYDSVASTLKNLTLLKTARNKANAETKVTVAGVEMTIDQALALKAANVYKTAFVATLRGQMNSGKARVDQVQAGIEQRISQQVQAASSGTKKATDEEIAVFRQLAERNTKIELVTFDGMKDAIERMAKELSDFATEVDYVLSEANATTKVQVVLA